ncbi:universal stress protein [Halobiforma nitratireducens]|uniref:UspA domain-containing protein n=1 Tax=Halobiforma nitratireducens JCM 10879 TaxID=1227454 RepID=M0LYN9_9EURY|nr:universal stress protein [Halobiforma nitratireducens]EMA37230.1 UspA domain-containing protein [Halobiforma nitratireducens JCM 10879]
MTRTSSGDDGGVAPGRPRTIVVATDGSAAATAALERAVGLATGGSDAADAVVHVLSVVDTTTDPYRFGVADVAELERTKRNLVDDIVAALDDPDCEVRAAVRRGRPDGVVLAYAAEVDADLLVVGRTGRSGLKRALLGSTTDRLLRKSSIPVLVVPEAEGTNGVGIDTDGDDRRFRSRFDPHG